MNKVMIMTPGPTHIDEEVRYEMAKPNMNPDLDKDFYEYYKKTTDNLKKILKTKNDVLILCGEGILGLEAACASLIERGDKVLCIDNGIFGNGFGDFAKIYGADVVYFKGDYEKGIDILELEEFLKHNNDFEVATLVHCETPSGITNPIEKVCKLLKKHNIITVVDSVSAIGGEELHIDDWNVDIVLGGSQKCLSAPAGLTFLSISDTAWNKILNRKLPIGSFYANLAIWKNWYEDKWFPYTQPINNIYGFNKAIERYLDEENPIYRHEKISNAVRNSLINSGLQLYAINSFSNTVTSVKIPDKISFDDINDLMLNDHNIMIGGAFGYLKDKIFRIGHMGENCYEEKLYKTLKALDEVLNKLGVSLKKRLHEEFVNEMK
jgi:aspartate aminotransferase-like enzyme